MLMGRQHEDQPTANRSTAVKRIAVLGFAILAVLMTTCVWAGLSLVEVFRVVSKH
jgi:hypothetical protein